MEKTMSTIHTIRRALCVLVVALVAGMMFATVPAYAEDGDGYSYTIRVYGGNEGTLSGGDPAEYTVAYGEEFVLDRKWVTLNDGSKYYVKGFRESGQDELSHERFTVTEDKDFVVAYGVQRDLVSYTLHFVRSGTTQALADPVTYYGNKGDKPVAAAEFIEGYRPLYRNITGTLGDEGTNNWTFEYVREEQPATNTTTTTTTTNRQTTTTTTTTGGTTTGGNAAGGTAATGTTTTGGNAAGGTAATGNNAAGGNAAGGNAAGGNEASPEAAPPTEEIRDIDNPLAGGNQSGSSASASNGLGGSSASSGLGSGTGTSSADSSGAQNGQQEGIPVPVIFGIAAGVVLAVALILYFLKRRREDAIEL